MKCTYPRISKLRHSRIRDRFTEWCDLLADSSLPRSSALNLYMGESWSVVKSLLTDQRLSSGIVFWIASAGYGLVQPSTHLTPYGATFTPREHDCVVPRGSSLNPRDWWQLLTEDPIIKPGSIHSIKDVAREYPESPILIAASRDYLRALEYDVLTSIKHLRSSNQMMIISTGSSTRGPLANSILPSSARLEHYYGKNRVSLNNRILSDIVRSRPVTDLSYDKLKMHMNDMLKYAPDFTRYDRARYSNDQIIRLIEKQLAETPNMSRSVLLERLRSSGIACEQKRFQRLYEQVVY